VSKRNWFLDWMLPILAILIPITLFTGLIVSTSNKMAALEKACVRNGGSWVSHVTVCTKKSANGSCMIMKRVYDGYCYHEPK